MNTRHTTSLTIGLLLLSATAKASGVAFGGDETESRPSLVDAEGGPGVSEAITRKVVVVR